MRRGAWHQCGWQSQTIASEMLAQNVGVGAILSPKSLALPKAEEYASTYHGHGAHVLIDPQFYVPDFTNERMESYQITAEFRTSVQKLHAISEKNLSILSTQIEQMNISIQADGVIAPAIVYEAGDTKIIDLNKRLFYAAKKAGDSIGVPTYATVVLGASVAASESAISDILSEVTSLEADGWYYAFQFDNERIPSETNSIFRCCAGGITLACTGKPVLHAYAGPMGLLSFCFGATGAAVGQFQNLWRFDPRNFQPSEDSQGGGGKHPPRFFSSTLWGTVVHPDETSMLSTELRNKIITSSPFTGAGPTKPPQNWSNHDANKHLVHTICTKLKEHATNTKARAICIDSQKILANAVVLYTEVRKQGIFLKDKSDTYQRNWRQAIEHLLKERKEDFDFLEML